MRGSGVVGVGVAGVGGVVTGGGRIYCKCDCEHGLGALGEGMM